MKHVILGAGPVGASTAAALVRRGESVVVVSRSPGAALAGAVVHVAADMRNARALAEACAGAHVLYQCLNAPNHRWREEFPALQDAAVAAARGAGARYVSFENVYMYGAPDHEPFGEVRPHAPCSDKGRVRAEMVDRLRGLHAQGALEVAHVRASDLFGPSMRASALGDELIGRAVAGKPARGFGELDAPHTWTFTRDAGEVLAAVGTNASAFGQVWHVPSDTPRSQRAVALAVAEILRRPVKISATPGWLLQLVGLVQPAAGAMVEMMYEFDRPFVVADTATRNALGVCHTPFAEALEATVRWFAGAATAR